LIVTERFVSPGLSPSTSTDPRGTADEPAEMLSSKSIPFRTTLFPSDAMSTTGSEKELATDAPVMFAVSGSSS
jgi:hypothetical protein